MLLAILIPTIQTRAAFLQRLLAHLQPQVSGDVRLIVDADDGDVSIGTKRNRLLKGAAAAAAEYVAFFDDDDLPAPNYVSELKRALQCRPDCVGFRVRRYSNEQDIGESVHSMACLEYRQSPLPDGRTVYWRTPNHLNPVRLEIAAAHGFPDQNWAEDRAYAEAIRPQLKTEVFLNAHLYEYWYRTPGNRPGEKTNG
jgi:hypothetical protein